MAGGLAFKIMFLDDSLETFALGLSDDVHKLPYLKYGQGEVADVVRNRLFVRKTKLANEFLGRAR